MQAISKLNRCGRSSKQISVSYTKKLLDEDVDLSLIEEQLKMCVQYEDTDG